MIHIQCIGVGFKVITNWFLWMHNPYRWSHMPCGFICYQSGFVVRNCTERKLTVMFGISVIFHQVFQFSKLFGKGSWKIYYHNSLILCVSDFSAALNISGHQGFFMISIRPLSKAWNTVNLRVVSSLFHCSKTQVLNSP